MTRLLRDRKGWVGWSVRPKPLLVSVDFEAWNQTSVPCSTHSISWLCGLRVSGVGLSGTQMVLVEAVTAVWTADNLETKLPLPH